MRHLALARQLVLGLTLTLATGCAANTGQILIDCTLDAGATVPGEIIQALGKDNWEEALAGLIAPVGRFLAEDLACYLHAFLANKKLAADPGNTSARDHARAYLVRHHYRVTQ
jgi:hypothetical protein